MKRTIYFDMDGTIADLYGVDNWLQKLLSADESPYEQATPMVDFEELNEILRAIKERFNIGIISWLCKGATHEYDVKVRRAKRKWLNENFEIELDEIHIVKYGTPKHYVAKDKMGILFDDEKPNRDRWKGQAFDQNEILKILKEL